MHYFTTLVLFFYFRRLISLHCPKSCLTSAEPADLKTTTSSDTTVSKTESTEINVIGASDNKCEDAVDNCELLKSRGLCSVSDK